MGDKSAIVASLLAESGPAGAGSKKLIEEVGNSANTESDEIEPVNEEGPSMLELMMAAQSEAKKAGDAVKQKEREKQSKKFGGGFKKGFFGSDPKSAKKKPSVTAPQRAQTTGTSSSASTAASVTPPTAQTADMPTVVPNREKKSSLMMDEVQEAMREGANPLLEKVKQGEWATPDLMNTLQGNPILARGLSNPKCMTALTLLQSDPTEAKKRFEKDPDVSLFLQEFGRVMADHFNDLGAKTDQQQKETSPSSGAMPVVQEIGPLHAEALNREKTMNAHTRESSGAVTVAAGTSAEDDERVKEIVQNDELRALLMDVQLQEILRECNDPRKFQMHMSNPNTAAKIKKLYAAGLVGTTK